MKRVCTYCQVTSEDFNQWCQEKHCPAEKASEIFDNGEWFGPIQIIEVLVILRSAVIYRARREDKPVLVKIANNGCEEKLRREAKAFLRLAQARQHPLLPVLLPAHPLGSVNEFPFGWTMVKGKSKHFMVFENAEGEVLRNFLLKNPQPWYQSAGWIALSIADVILYLHQAGSLHLCLNPEMILLRFDKQGIPRPMLLDLGVGEARQDINSIWTPHWNHPAYTPPEVLNRNGKIGQTADVYGLGLLLYEMLAGGPAFPYHLKRDQRVIRDVLAVPPAALRRADLRNLPDLAEQSIQRNANSRPQSVAAFAQSLQRSLPPIPAERKKFQINWKVVLMILGSLLLISLLIVFASAIVQ